MKSLADGLPPEIARQIHPDWRKNEAAYWLKRDALLSQYEGQWIAFAKGAVIVAARAPLEIFLAVQNSDDHPFVVRVGHEDEPLVSHQASERILGRDVLNRIDVLFRGPLGKVILNP